MRSSHQRSRAALCALVAVAGTLSATLAIVAPAAQAAVDYSVIKINEVSSNPSDVVELTNTGTSAIDVGGLKLRDNDVTRTPYAIPAGTTIAAGGFLVLQETGGTYNFGFGLGANDEANLFQADGTTLIDSYAWTTHRTPSYGRCPDGTGPFVLTSATSFGAANQCGPVYDTIKINEVESSGGTPGDWVEIKNTGTAAVDLGGVIFKDNVDTDVYTIPSGTTLAAGAYLVLDEAQFVFGLGGGDSARLFAPNGTTLIDTYTWTAHATTTYGRCPDGTGAFATTAAPTKGATNSCVAGGTNYADLKINEVESNGGTPGDWVELRNNGTGPLDIGGLKFRDNDTTHVMYTIPTGTTVAAGGYYLLEEAAFGFGLGTADSATVWQNDGSTVIDLYSWTTHAVVTYGRCPDGTGAFVDTASSTKGAANDCRSPIKINEVESSGGTPGDWVELINPSGAPVDIGGYVFKDNDDTHGFVVPAGTSVPAGGYLVLDEAQFSFGLGAPDSARLFAPDGTTLIDTYAWTAHATTTYGRCPNGTGDLATTQAPTKGTANSCAGDLVTGPWPGGQGVTTIDPQNTFASNLSGLMYEPTGTPTPGAIWAVRNGPGSLYKLTRTQTGYAPDAGFAAGGKLLHYPDGTGDVDAEGVTFTAAGPGAGIFVASERNNANNGVSRPAILRFDPAAPGAELSATNDWNLTADLPGLGANLGLEAISWVPDSYLTAKGFKDGNTNAAYDPASYPNHGTGLFLVGVEQTGMVYAYALDLTSNSYTRVASFASGFPSVMELYFEPETQKLWVVCDDTCQGRSSRFDVNASGVFAPGTYYERPTGMANLNNEGFTLAPRSECVSGLKPAFWSDDSSTGGYALRAGTVECTPLAAQTVAFTSTAPTSPVVGQTYDVAATGGASGNPVTFSESSDACSLSGATVTITAPGSCLVTASQAGGADHLAGSATQDVTSVKAATTAVTTVGPDSLRAVVSVVAPGAATVGGAVVFQVDGATVGTAPVVDGTATLTHVTAPGASRTITAAYGGSALLEATTATVQRHDPTVTAALSSSVPQSAEGWWTAPVTVTFTCAPQGAAVSSCPEPVVLAESGADVGVTRQALAADGGVGTATLTGVKIDLEAPTVRVVGVRDGETYALDAPQPRCAASDALSGVVRCTLAATHRGRVTSVTATAVDLAGNTATTSVSWRRPVVRIDGALRLTADGAYVVRRGTPLRVVAMLAGAPQPRVLRPVAQGRRLLAPSVVMRRGHIAGGLATWGRTVTASAPGRDQKVAVQVGGRRIVVRLRLA